MVTSSFVVVQLSDVRLGNAFTPIVLRQPNKKGTYRPTFGEVGVRGHVLVRTKDVRPYREENPNPSCGVAAPSKSDATQRNADAALRRNAKFPQVLDKFLDEVECNVKGDIFHAVKGILHLCKKSHPGFVVFARCLGDTFLAPVEEDVNAAVDLRVEEFQLSREEIDPEKKYHWKKIFLRNARRRTGSRVEQLYRYLKVMAEFKQYKDPCNENEPLIRPKAERKMNAVAVKIAQGYYADPVGVDLPTLCALPTLFKLC
jgi:hypothetical protein